MPFRGGTPAPAPPTAARSITYVLGLALAFVLAGALTGCGSDSVSMQPAGAVSSNDERVGDADKDAHVTFGLGLQRDQGGLTAKAVDISTPGNKEYRHFLSAEKIASEYGASKDVVEEVTDAVSGNGLSASSDATRSFVTVTGTVEAVGDLLGTSFGEYRASDGSRYVSSEDTATVPSAIASDVTELIGLVSTVAPAPAKSLDAATGHADGGTPSGCDAAQATGAFVADQLNDAYGVSALQASGYLGQGRSVAMVETHDVQQAALDGFAECFDLPRLTAEVHVVASEKDSIEPPDLESALDAEMIMAATPQLASLHIFEVDLYLPPVFALADAFDPDNTGGQVVDSFVTSVFYCESDLSDDGLALDEHLFAAGAAMGVSSIAASGDRGGAGCYPDEDAAVQYPASSYFVTAVGGTSITLDAANAITAEQAWGSTSGGADLAGGGGTSARIAVPEYQSELGHSHRAVPDIAMFADEDEGIAIYGCTSSTACTWTTIGGTSAAAPFFAGGATLVDQSQAQQNQPTLGFLNPLLYSLSDSANVITDTARGSTELFGLTCCTAGTGYDLATGLGSPNLAALSENVPPPG